MGARDTHVALRRFGLGARPHDAKRIANDPRGYVLSALRTPDAALLTGAGLRHSAHNLTDFRELAQEARAERRARQERTAPDGGGAKGTAMNSAGMANAGGPPGERALGRGSGMVTEMGRRGDAMPVGGGAMQGGGGAMQADVSSALQERRDLIRDIVRAESTARFQRAAATELALLERLVQFWSNHFCISEAKGGAVRAIAGAYEREAIRPHILGPFKTLLRAAEQHPAMLDYLDGMRSIGPTSRAGQRQRKGLNENHAREILELHTLGADGGYTQEDVTHFARILTGWTVAGPNSRKEQPGRFVFQAARHEPGARTVLGKRYADRGLETGQEVLDDLARHPATARLIARKLAQHFVGDDAPAALTDTLEATFRQSDGDLMSVTRVMVTAEAAWRREPKKIVPPYDFIISMVRAFDLPLEPMQGLRMAGALGQPLWRPPSPKGWPDDDDAWSGPSVLRERLRVAGRVARMVHAEADPRALAAELTGDDASSYALQAIARAETRAEGIEMLIMSPGFQRR